MSETDPPAGEDMLARLDGQLEAQIARLAAAPSFAKVSHVGRVFDLARRMLSQPGGFELLYREIEGIEAAGVFIDDWANPETLQPALVSNSVRMGDRTTVLVGSLNMIRMLAVAKGDYLHPGLSAEQAHHFLIQLLALNLDLVFGVTGEAERERLGSLADMVRTLYLRTIEEIGYGQILDKLIEEVWRILAQRPIILGPVKAMIGQIAACQVNPDIDIGGAGRGADRLVSALFSPTNGCREDPGLAVFAERLEAMDSTTLMQEAMGFARAMHDTGLVSPYHAVFLRFALEHAEEAVPEALGLSATGRDSLLCYQNLVTALIREAIHPQTAQAIYGLALLLERGLLHVPAVAPALWRQINLALAPVPADRLQVLLGTDLPARVHLLAGVLNVLGQPLGVGQGNNPTCQAARAISLWALNDPSYLLQMIAWAARDDEVGMQFENVILSSTELAAVHPGHAVFDVDPVSLVLVPHLDRLYAEMGRLCIGRGEDPHHWINPEFHGWWTDRDFAIALDIGTGQLSGYDGFLRLFYAAYHPLYNGNQPVIHAQPAGIAVTDSAARFVGWHAISILRVGLDQDGVMRVYFYNPNNDGGQDWGNGVVVATEGTGERFGESSLPMRDFASRLYIFHYDRNEMGNPQAVPVEEVEEIVAMGGESWARDRC